MRENIDWASGGAGKITTDKSALQLKYLEQGLTEGRGCNRRFQSSLDCAGRKKHNIVVKKAGLLTIVETRVLEMEDDLKHSFAEDLGTRQIV